MTPSFDAVVIGRNEARRIGACLAAVAPLARRVIYVDSGSRDDSVAQARAAGVEVIELDANQPFTAARGRNTGFAALQPGIAEFVQFIDADCILEQDWPATAIGFLRETPKAALVFGRQFEARPDASIFNFLIDWEWNKPLGSAQLCAGCVMMRSAALADIGGYEASLIAGEDDDLCRRLQARGWQTWRIDALMSEHDAQLLALSPWWRRTTRAGHSYAALALRHPEASRAQLLRAIGWGGVLPALAVLGLILWPPLVGLVLVLYAASFLRQMLRFRRMALSADRAAGAAGATILGKLAEFQGVATFWLRRLAGRQTRLIEYK